MVPLCDQCIIKEDLEKTTILWKIEKMTHNLLDLKFSQFNV